MSNSPSQAPTPKGPGSQDSTLGVPHSKKPPLPISPASSSSTRDNSPAKLSFGGPDFLSPSSRRNSQQSYDPDSRRGSVKNMALDAMKDVKKGVKKVTDSTVEAGHKVKDKTAEVSTSVKSATKDAGKWVATQSSKKAKAAMEQAKSGLSCTEKFTLYAVEKISVLSRRGFTHVFMFLIMVLYTALGAALFMAVEGSNQTRTREKALQDDLERIKTINNEKEQFLKQMYNYRSIEPYDDYKMQALLLIEKHLVNCDFPSTNKTIEDFNALESDWTFWKAMFFSSTISTTIGYGSVVPRTGLGQVITLVYALIGIPLFLILLADFGKLFTRMLKQLFMLWARVKKSRPYMRAREHPVVQRVLKKVYFVTNILTCKWKKQGNDEEIESTNPEDYFNDGNFNLPVSLALGILIVYILIGSFLFTIWEDWNTFEAFYFIFISMTTIGFGDYVPKHQGFMMGATVYLVFGLALTAMSINIIQEKLTDTFNKASVKLKESFKNVMSSMLDEDEEDKDHAGKNGTEVVLNVEACS